MSTSNVSAGSATPPQPPIKHDAPHDEFSGAFGFFRKYQKLILYTAVLFALVTFSITGPVMSFVQGLFGHTAKVTAHLQVNASRQDLLPEDRLWGAQLATHRTALQNVLPRLGDASNSTELTTVYAVLRRASIAEGLDVSMAEVDKAIAALTAMVNHRMQSTSSPAQIARLQGMESLAQYRELMREAMRIGNYVRLNSIGVDGSDAALMAAILEGEEKITLRAAQFDMKAAEEQLKTTPIGEDDLKKWLEGKTEAEKTRLQVYDTNLVSLLLGIGWLDKFDPAQWGDELKDFKFADDQMKQLYAEEKERFKLEKPQDGKEYRPLEDQAVKDELTKVAQLGEVLEKLRQKLVTQQQEALKEPLEKLTKAAQEKAQAQGTLDAAKKAAEAKPDDADLKKQLHDAEDVFKAKELAETDEKKALDAARLAFDFRGRFAELTKDKAGFELKELKGPKNADGLRDLKELDLGEWKRPEFATVIRDAGEIGGTPARTPKGGFVYQVTEVVLKPLKAWDKLKTSLEAAYYQEQSKKQGDEHKQKFEDALLALAKEKIADKVAEIEARRQPEIDKEFADWEQKQKAELARADQVLTGGEVKPGTQAYDSWKVSKDQITAALEKRDDKKQEIAAAEGKKLDAEIKAEAKKKYAEVVDAAAQQAGFTVVALGPYWREVTMKDPALVKPADKAVGFLWGGAGKELKAGEATDVLEDVGNRRWILGVCDVVEPLAATDVPRREFAMQQRNYHFSALTFAEDRVRAAIAQSFTLDALKKRYDFQEETGEQETGSRPR